MKGMKHAVILSAMLTMAPVSAPIPALAQQGDDQLSRGAELLSQGMGLILEGLLSEMRPTGEELADGWAEAWADMVEMLNDFSAYEAPIILPNGDILIRRKVPLVPPVADGEGGEGGEIDL